MGNPNLFFRTSELNSKTEVYHKTRDSINSSVDSFFSNINSLDDLYYKVGLLENKEEIFRNFKNTASAIESFGTTNVKLNSEKYVDPFSYSPSQGFNPASSEGFFYIGIAIFVIFLVSLIKRWKIRTIFGILLLIAVVVNLYNYQVVEPEYLASSNFEIEAIQYEKKAMESKAEIIFIDLYQPQTRYSSRETYEYDVIGVDEYGNDVEGHIETNDDSGSGYIINRYGDKVEIEVEWYGKGKLKGESDNGDRYDLVVER